ncbi:hypothetical protein Sspor_15230 [Streptomyces spororaveus]|uniref:Barstar (Barnase inhibitor) n=1 Tax=Streptomyces spororaveus TaxID=284039 RepID=A0ABQ3T722_9ACTN|nr:hypothetical protein Sspor_15230 [Streptomyces spororaveus]
MDADALSSGVDEVGSAEYGELLGQGRGFHAYLGEEFGDCVFALAQEFQDADAYRVAEGFEELCLQLVEGSADLWGLVLVRFAGAS